MDSIQEGAHRSTAARDSKQLRRSHGAGYHQKRRLEALQRQADARRSLVDRARELALGKQHQSQTQQPEV